MLPVDEKFLFHFVPFKHGKKLRPHGGLGMEN